MPRTAGQFTVINTFVPGTTITAVSHNQNWADAANEISNSVAADGQTPLTGPLQNVAGSFAAPGMTFVGDLDTGIYRVADNTIGIATGGANRVTISDTQVTFTVPIVGPNHPFPAGTRMLFQQTAAPTGWVKDATLDDRALRIVGGSVVGGGTVPFSTFLARTTTDAKTLIIANLPSHTHGGTTNQTTTDHTHSWGGTFATGFVNGGNLDHIHGNGGSVIDVPQGTLANTHSGAGGGNTLGSGSLDHTHNVTVGGTTGGFSANHQHTFTTDPAGSGTAFTTNIDCRLLYTDAIVAQKS